tara:strand:+ start:3154 stop:3567 length:414 start_codon:yes stop_codon:yes gene_type:complete
MNYASKPMKKKLDQLALYLAHEGFTVGRTATGIVAVDDDGIVIQVSPFRTSVQVRHRIHGRFREEYVKKLPTPDWFTTRIPVLMKWAQDPHSKEMHRSVSVSRRPSQSRAILASICPPSTPMTISSNTSAQPLKGKG